MASSEPAVAICGIGHWGRKLVREFVRLTNVAGVFGVGNLHNRNWIMKNYPSLGITTNLEQFLRRKDVSAVIIATPPDTHAELALAALRNNKHVFVEKPLSTHPDQVKHLYAEATRRQLCLFVGHIFLYHPVFEYIINHYPPSSWREVRFTWQKFGTFKYDIIQNLFIHDLAISQRLFGVAANILLLEATAEISDSDQIQVKMVFNNDIVCYSRINRVSTVNFREMLFRSENETLIWSGNRLFLVDRSKQALPLLYEATEQALTRECRHFLNCIQHARAEANEEDFEHNLARTLSHFLTSIRSPK